MRLKNPKAKGSRLERQSRDIFLRAGFIVVKAGGSLGCADLIALNPEVGHVTFVQVKANRWPGRAEMARLEELSQRCRKPESWRVIIHRWDDRVGLRIKVV